MRLPLACERCTLIAYFSTVSTTKAAAFASVERTVIKPSAERVATTCSVGASGASRTSLRLPVAIDLVAEGEDRYLDAVLQVELGEDAADVGFDCLLADR